MGTVQFFCGSWEERPEVISELQEEKKYLRRNSSAKDFSITAESVAPYHSNLHQSTIKVPSDTQELCKILKNVSKYVFWTLFIISPFWNSKVLQRRSELISLQTKNLR